MKKIGLYLAALMIAIAPAIAEAKGGMSSSGGRGGFSSSSRSVSSSPSTSYGSPSTSSSKSSGSWFSSKPSSTTTTRTTSTYSSSSRGSYGSMGTGYDYSNGMLTGLIIGNLMHPHGTTVYAGPGPYANNAVVYPSGQVVNQNGQQVGTYTDGKFTPVENGQIVAQKAPADAFKKEPSFGDIILVVLLGTLVLSVLTWIIWMAITWRKR